MCLLFLYDHILSMINLFDLTNVLLNIVAKLITESV